MPQLGSYSQSEVNLSDDPSANRTRKTKILEKISFYGGQAFNEARAKFLLGPPKSWATEGNRFQAPILSLVAT
jgi:hypothetical protein